MFDRYIIVDNSLRNLTENGEIVGFAFDARCGYYRRLILSMVEDLAVTVDGQVVDSADVALDLRGVVRPLSALPTEFVEAWEFGEIATVVVSRPGGLAAGEHQIGLREQLRISYLPFPHTPETTQKQEVHA